MPKRIVRTDRDHRTTTETVVEMVPVRKSLRFVETNTILAESVYDRNGLLLVRKGTELSDLIRELLQKRGVAEVIILEKRIKREAVSPSVPPPTRQTRRALINQELNRKLQARIQSGLNFVNNLGPTADADLCWHDAERYEPNFRRQVIQEHETTLNLLRELMPRVHQGGEIHALIMQNIVQRYLQFLLDDMDSVLTVPISASGELLLAGRCLRLSLLGMSAGIHLGLTIENVRRIGLAGLMHDWGLLTVPLHFWNGQTEASAVRELEIQRHPTCTANYLERVLDLPPLVLRVAYQVHEKLDGTGYPRGELGPTIHHFSRILHVCDAYLEMTRPTVKQPALMPYTAMETLLRGSAMLTIDGLAVRGLLRAQSLFPLGSYALLSNDTIVRTLRANGDNYTKPIVQVVHVDTRSSKQETEIQMPSIVDLSNSELTIERALPTPGRGELATPNFLATSDGQSSPRKVPTASVHIAAVSNTRSPLSGPKFARATQRQTTPQ